MSPTHDLLRTAPRIKCTTCISQSRTELCTQLYTELCTQLYTVLCTQLYTVLCSEHTALFLKHGAVRYSFVYFCCYDCDVCLYLQDLNYSPQQGDTGVFLVSYFVSCALLCFLFLIYCSGAYSCACSSVAVILMSLLG
jgi:hypothetical protein